MKQHGWRRLASLALAVAMGLTLLSSSALGAVYEGERNSFSGTWRSVRLTLSYQYSPTGGMAGINAHAPETVEFYVNEEGETIPASWPIPYYSADGDDLHHDHDHNNLAGFRVVLNAEPLNRFVKTPPTGNETAQELEEKLNRGDFDPDPEKMTDTAAVTQAWIDARTFTDQETGLTFQLVDKNGSAAQGSDPLDGPRLILKNPERLAQLEEDPRLTLAVNYRRDNGAYSVKHWIPRDGVLAPDMEDPLDWTLHTEEPRQGRIGAMTNAQAKFIQGYVNHAFSQQPIQADGSTVMDIFYTKDETIRVIFDTSEAISGEIPRQTLDMGDESKKTVDFSSIAPGADNAPVKPGYQFTGWSYRDKDSGELHPVTSLAGYHADTNTLTPDAAFLSSAQLQVSQETAGVNVLQFYPLWDRGETSVRVVFWTEDLTGVDDVEDGLGDREVKTHYFEEEGAAYSNVGFMTLEGVRTNTKLEIDLGGSLNYTDRNGAAAALQLKDELAKLPTMAIQTSYQGEGALKDASGFYTLDGGMITQMDGTSRDTRDADTAAPNGTTVVNVYYTRNIYQLKFTYSVEEEGHTKVAFDAGGFVIPGYDGNAQSWLRIVAEGEEENIPAVQTITAKYGADLRDIWPCRNDIQVTLRNDQGAVSAFFISWCTTMGPYAEEARRCWAGGPGSELRKQYEPTIMGVYGAMSADIIADPAQHLGQEDYQEETGTHKLYAFWWRASSYYRYNHCYEVPGVTQSMLEEQPGVVKMVLDGQSENDIRNIGYLIPADGDGDVMKIIRLYGFDDLRRASYDPDSEANQVIVDGEGDYYAFRVYQGKCYALSRQVNAASTNIISAQNPSARAHMRRLNTVADHSTKYQPSDGAAKDESTRIGTVDAPYDLFFYYDRVPYQVIYSVGSSTGLKDLGTKQIYYGAQLSDFYNIQLTSGFSPDGQTTVKGSTNGDYAVSLDTPNGWVLPATSDAAGEGKQPVCPNRNEKGTTPWHFKGWAMDLAGTELLDDSGDWQGVVSGDLHLYAQWEAPAYTVEFDWNGGHLAFGSDEDYKEQQITANSTIARGGAAPVPVKAGYYLDHWRVTHYRLNDEADWVSVKAADYVFLFDNRVSLSLKVQAVWKPIEGAEVLRYTVSHVLADDPTVKLAEDQEVEGSFVRGSMVWGSPIQLGSYQGKDYSDYVPTVQNAGALVPRDGDVPIAITITYRPPTAADAYRYTVRFAEQGTDKVIHTATLSAPEAIKTVYAGAYAQKLDELGYWLAKADGTPQFTSGDDLLQTLSAGEGTGVAQFPVIPEEYPISYVWTAGMDEAVSRQLEAALPHSYVPVRGELTLPIPGGGSYAQGGKTWSFTGWKLTKGALVRGTNPGNTVSISPESRGALEFQTQWSAESRGVYFYPGAHGALASDVPLVAFTGLLAVPLVEQEGFAVPEIRADKEYSFTGWKLDGDGSGKLYSAEQVAALVPQVGNMIFTAQYKCVGGGQPVDPQPTDPKPTDPQKPDKPGVDNWLDTANHIAYIIGRGKHQIKPEAEITRAEVATIFCRLLTTEVRARLNAESVPFTDVSPENWFYKAVAMMAQAGIIEGYPDGTFRPNASITRGEFVTMATRFLGGTYEGTFQFSDAAWHWAADAVTQAALAGWIKGYPDGSFRPDGRIKRGEAITMVNAMLNRVPHKDHLLEDMTVWTDNADPAAWYYLAVQEATNAHDYTWHTEQGEEYEIWVSLRKD